MEAFLDYFQRELQHSFVVKIFAVQTESDQPELVRYLPFLLQVEKHAKSDKQCQFRFKAKLSD
jgi:hypothetical protein